MSKEPKFNLLANNYEQNIIKKEDYNTNIIKISEEEIKS